MRPPKGDVWSGHIDHERWHALVNVGTSKVLFLFRPHMRGTLRVYYQSGQEELHALVSAPSAEMVRACKEGRAAFGADGLREAPPAAPPARALLLRELAEIDAATRAHIAEGVDFNGLRHSLSVNAIAKLEAMLDPMNLDKSFFPVSVSTADNLGEIVLGNTGDVRKLIEAVRLCLRALIAEGDRLKAAARSRAAGG